MAACRPDPGLRVLQASRCHNPLITMTSGYLCMSWEGDTALFQARLGLRKVLEAPQFPQGPCAVPVLLGSAECSMSHRLLNCCATRQAHWPFYTRGHLEGGLLDPILVRLCCALTPCLNFPRLDGDNGYFWFGEWSLLSIFSYLMFLLWNFRM